MNNDAITKYIVDEIMVLIETYIRISQDVEKNKIKQPTHLLTSVMKDIPTQIQRYMSDLQRSGNLDQNILNTIVNGIKDKVLSVDMFEKIVCGDLMMLQETKPQTKIQNSIELLQSLFGVNNIKNIFDEIIRQKLTLIVYRTKDGYKLSLCSPDKINETLPNILPKVIYNGNVKIQNLGYAFGGYGSVCNKYICNSGELLKHDICILPSTSNSLTSQSSVTEDARQQYKNVYEKIFKFFNKKNVPISLTQFSACKGNNFTFALSDCIEGDTKIDTLEFSTLNIISGMLIPNFHSKYADTAVKCFYNKNINHLKIHFNYTVPAMLFLHSLPGSVGYATETISKILEKAENKDKTEQMSIINKVLKSFDNTINTLIDNKGTNKTPQFIRNVDIVINDKQFVEELKHIKTVMDKIEDIYQPLKDWVFTSIDEFTQQNPQNAVSFTEILKNSKLYNEKTMSPTLAGFEVLEKNKNTIQEFMSKHRITEEDLNKATEDIEKKIDDEKDIQEKNTSINNSIMRANNISSMDIMEHCGEMQKKATYTTNQQKSNNTQSDSSLHTLNDKKNRNI